MSHYMSHYFDSPTLGLVKLVRDGIPQQIRARGGQEKILFIPPAERVPALLAKLREEVREALAAKGDAALAEELADITEVIKAIEDILWLELGVVGKGKRQRLGRFSEFFALRAADVEAWKARP